MLDLQDLLPYLFSISLLLILRYFYLMFVYGGLRLTWIDFGYYDHRIHFVSIPAPGGGGSPSRLSRMVRRREAPDEDGGDCLFLIDDVSDNRQGGAVCNRQKDSFSVQKEDGFSA